MSHVLPDEPLLQVLEGPHLGLHVLGSVTGLLQQTHQAVHLLGVIVDHLHGALVAPAAYDGVLVVGHPLDGIVVALVQVGHGQCEAPQVVPTLPQDVGAVGHAALPQVVLCFLAGDIAIEERQGAHIVGHLVDRRGP